MSKSKNNSYELFKYALRNSRVVSMPKNNISTFGNTVYNYYYVGKTSTGETQVREGHIRIKRPLFVTPYNAEEMFKGFGGEQAELAKKLMGDINADPLVFVEYQFDHIAKHEWVEKSPYPIVLSEIKTLCDDQLFNVLVTGDTSFWSASVIKFCFKIIEKSFPINLSEIEERGFFDKNNISPQLRQKTEELFAEATVKSSRVKALGDFLVSNNIFDFYEERFFQLMEQTKKNAP